MSADYDSFVRDRLPPSKAQPEFLFASPELLYPDRLNAAAEVMRGGRADAPALISDEGVSTFSEIDALSDRIARLLVEQEGLDPGNRVLLRGPNGLMLFASWLGVLKAGGIVVATMPMLRGGEIATILERAKVSHALVDAAGRADFDEGAARAGILRSIVSWGGELEARLAYVAPGFPAFDSGRDDPALIAFTSGTTGDPKGCVQYHRDILACADSFARTILAPSPDDRWLCSAPIAFTFGLGMSLIFPWRFGGAAVIAGAPGPAALLEALARHRVTILATAPTAWKAMVPIAGTHDLSSLRLCISAGEHLPAAVWHAWRDATGHRLIDGIGATELMHIFISASGETIRPGSTGKAVPGYVATVLDEANRPQDEGTGRLAVKGPTGCRYFDDPRQADYVVDGWNVTGDTYRKDEKGYFWYLARSDDMIVSAGYNIAAPEVENALLSHPAVQECAVVGIPCEERGRKVKAFVLLAPGHEPGETLAAALQDHVKATIAPYKYPREVEFVDALPRTITGKLQRYALRGGAA